MKYPQQHFDNLVAGLQLLSEHFEIDAIHPNQLYYTVYQQKSDGQKHNWLMINGDKIQKAHSLQDATGWEPLFKDIAAVPLYPEGCNDTHIETAVKQAMKQVKQLQTI